MKKGIFLAISLTVLAACSKVQPSEPSLTDVYANQELSFMVAKAMSTTKADTRFEGTEFKNVDGFGVYAWFTGESVSEYWMKDVNVTKQTENGKTSWKPVVPYYWPKDHTLDFLCYAPYNNGHCWFTVSDDATNMASNGKSNKLTAHLVVSNSTGDLLYADKALKCTNSFTDEVKDGLNAFTGVPVIFRHALSMASFQIQTNTLFNDTKTMYAKVTFKSATLNNVHNEGDLTLKLKNTGETASTRQWENKNSDGTWDVNDNTTTINDDVTGDMVVGTDAEDFISDTIFIPQNLDDQSMDLNIVIEFYETTNFAKDPETGEILIDPGTGMPYILVDNPEGGDPIKLGPNDPGFPSPTQSEPIHKHQDLKDIPGVDTWGMGGNTDYTITVTPFSNAITFDPVIAIWNDIESDSFVYPENN